VEDVSRQFCAHFLLYFWPPLIHPIVFQARQWASSWPVAMEAHRKDPSHPPFARASTLLWPLPAAFWTFSKRVRPTCADAPTWCWMRPTECWTWASSRRFAESSRKFVYVKWEMW
jgi:hypothetical protein